MSKYHVLVVDDDKSSADTTVLAVGQFSNGEISAEAVYGGKACLARLDHPPMIDLILLDLNMPEVNGADVIRTVLKREPLPKFKILPTTAWGSDWIKHWGLSQLQTTLEFQKTVVMETCDKATDLSEMVDQVRRTLGLT